MQTIQLFRFISTVATIPASFKMLILVAIVLIDTRGEPTCVPEQQSLLDHYFFARIIFILLLINLERK